MTAQEFALKLQENIAKQDAARKAIAEYARTLIPVLLDAGRAASAKELERLFFEYDVRVQESVDLSVSNPDALIQFLGLLGKRFS